MYIVAGEVVHGMTYQLDELTLLSEAIQLLIRGGVNVNLPYMRDQLSKGKIKGRKVGLHYWVLTSEIQRLQDEAIHEKQLEDVMDHKEPGTC